MKRFGNQIVFAFVCLIVFSISGFADTNVSNNIGKDTKRIRSASPFLSWNTFQSCSDNDYGCAIAVDTSGNVYVAGESDGSWGLPFRPFAGRKDALVAKISSEIITQSMIAMWHFDEGSGEIANDATGNGHNLLLRGGGSWVQGKSGAAISLDGINDFLESLKSEDFIFPNNTSFTISLWLKTNMRSSRIWQGIITKGYDFYPLNNWYQLSYNDISGKVTFGTESISTGISTTIIGNDEWHQIRIVRDHLRQVLDLYIDGILEQSASCVSSIGFGNNAGSLIFGRHAGDQRYFKGTIDEVMIYSSAVPPIDPPQITSLFPSSGPVGTQVKISGSKFLATTGKVTFTGLNSKIKYWSDVEIIAEVPTNATSGQVIVESPVWNHSNSMNFVVESPGTSGVTIQIDSIPAPLTSGQSFEAKWTITGGTKVTSTNIYYTDKASHQGFLEGLGSSPGTFSKYGTINVASDKTLYFRAEAVVDSKTYYSPEISRLVKAESGTPPEAPSILTIQGISAYQLDIAWSHSSPSNVKSYILYFKTAAESGWQSKNIFLTGTPSNIDFTLNGLTPKTIYTVKILARNEYGYSAPSQEVSASTIYEIISSPSNLKANTAYDSSTLSYAVNLSWSWSMTLLTGEFFQLENKKSEETIWIPLEKTQNMTFKDEQVKSGATYDYRIKIQGPKRCSDYSNPPVSLLIPKSTSAAIEIKSNLRILQVRPGVDLVAEKATVIVVPLKSVQGKITVSGELYIDEIKDMGCEIVGDLTLPPDEIREIRFYPSRSKLTARQHTFRIVINCEGIPYPAEFSKEFIATKAPRMILVRVETPAYKFGYLKNEDWEKRRKILEDYLKAVFPFSEDKIHLDISKFSYAINFELNGFLNELTRISFACELNKLKKNDYYKDYDYLIGIVPKDSLDIGGFVFNLLNNVAFIVDNYPKSQYAKDYYSFPSLYFSQYFLAHEIGHVAGLYLGKELYDYDNYPIDYRIGQGCESAFLRKYFRADLPDQIIDYLYNIIIDESFVDIMGEGVSCWAIMSTYNHLLSKYSQNSTIAKAQATYSGKYVLLSGWINKNSNIAYNLRAFVRQGEYSADSSSQGNYGITCYDSTGKILSNFLFEQSFQFRLGSSDGVDQAPFLITLSLPDGTKKIEINHNSIPIGTLYASPHSPNVSIATNLNNVNVSENVQINWEGADLDGDSLSYNVYYSEDNGTSWEPIAVSIDEPSYLWNTSRASGTKQGKIKVEATDGFNTIEAISAGTFSIDASKGPIAGISFPVDGANLVVHSYYQFVGSATDPEDGNIPDNNLVWLSERDGQLGTGSRLNVNCLSEGTHTITLKALDSEGNMGTQSVNVTMIKGYSLDLHAFPAGMGAIYVSSQDKYFPPNAQVTLTAFPEAGYQFSRWGGAIDSNQNPITFVMDSNKSISASFVEQISPKISLSTSSLSFGAVKDGGKTSDQQFRISNSGGGVLTWALTTDKAWLSCTPASGSGNGVITVSVNPNNVAAGTAETATIQISSLGASNSPQSIKVMLSVKDTGTSLQPFGSFDTPIDGTIGVSGAIPVTGWAADDIEVTKVEIWRDNVTGETPGQWYIGDAIFVEGARPDIETIFPDYPLNYRAGWGYMLLTNMLPNHGNGTYKLHAYAYDKEGNRVLLGTKTITCSNATAVKPFGTIDSPSQGGDASGNPYLNFGWVLTPLTKTVPKNGSTILVYVDGAYLGNLGTAPNVYDQYRADVSTAFPGLNNTGAPGAGGPVGAYFLDTTKYPIGVHTIAWVATDDGGAADGIGSRYFNIFNTGASAPASAQSMNLEKADFYESVINLPVSFEPRKIKRGFSLRKEPEVIPPDNYGILHFDIKEVERIEIDLGNAKTIRGYQIVGEELRPLPIGSTLDQRTGTFSWMPGPGFIGTYELLFLQVDGLGITRRIPVKVIIKPKFEK